MINKFMKNFTREYINENIANSDNFITLSVASDAPYTRYDEKGNAYDEVLQISENAIDFSRLVDERCPFIYEHDTDKQLGVVEKAYIADNKLYVDVRFSENEFPQSVLKDITSGIRRNTSIGYSIKDYTMIKNPNQNPTMLVTKWMPYECSSVSCPADFDVGYNRSLNVKEKDNMEDENKKPTEAVEEKPQDEVKSEENIEETPKTEEKPVEEEKKSENIPEDSKPVEETKECNQDEDEIRSLGDLVNQRALAEKFISEKRSLADFKTTIKNNTNNNVIKEKKMEKYSLRKAILNATSKGKFDPESVETKVNDELKRKYNIADADVVIPNQRAIDGSEVLNQADYRPDMYAGVLRQESTIAKVGATYVGVDGPSINFAVATSGAVGGFVDLNGEIPSATVAWEQKSLTPKKFGAYIEINYKALLQDRPEIESLITDDILKGVDEIKDKALICGTGTNNEPTGIYTLTSLNEVTMPSGDWTLSTALAFEKPIRDANITTNNLKWVMSSDKYYELACTPKSAVEQNEFLIEDGKMIGYDVIIDNHLPSSGVILGDFSEAIVADFEPISLKVVEDAALSRKQAVEVQAFGAVDVCVRRPKAFTKGV